VAGLKDPKLMAKKRTAEQNLRKRSTWMRSKRKSTRAWTKIARRARLAAYERDRRFMDLAAGFTRCCSDTRARCAHG